MVYKLRQEEIYNSIYKRPNIRSFFIFKKVYKNKLNLLKELKELKN